MAKATITSSGRITIPKEVRTALGLVGGDRVEFIAESSSAFMMVAATRDVRHLKGMIAKPAKPVSIEDMNRAVARAASRK